MSTAATTENQHLASVTAEERETPLPLRSDTFLGVFEAIGQDLGFNPNWLRVPFGALILWNPALIVGSYLALGCIVALARWFFPVSTGKPATAAAGEAEREPVESAERKQEELAIAA
jgi:phage shock protein PspC (stress-responsive transcriptional regulator)